MSEAATACKDQLLPDLTEFPWTHPSVFRSILVMTESPATVLACRAVCGSWRDWVSESGSLWAAILHRLLLRAIRRWPGRWPGGPPGSSRLHKVWDLRLDLLLEMEDECGTEEDIRRLAIRVDRAYRQRVYREYEDTLNLLDVLCEAHEAGDLFSAPTGPICMFVRCKVSHPGVLRIVGEILARHLNSIVIDSRDKEVGVVRQSLLRAMISTSQPPRWVFKDREAGWLADQTSEEEKIMENCEDESEPGEDDLPSRGLVASVFSLGRSLWASLAGMLSGLFLTKLGSKDPISIEESTDGDEETHGYSLPPPPLHPDFPTVMELLDLDVPWLRSLLVKKAGIDKKLVVPDFQQIGLLSDLLDSEATVVGLDLDGSVVELDCSTLEEKSEGALLGYIDLPAAVNTGKEEGVHFWEERDVRGRWPQFANQLETLVVEEIECPKANYSETDTAESEYSDSSECGEEEEKD